MWWSITSLLQLLISLQACDGGDYVIEATCSGEEQCRMLQEIFATRIPKEINITANTNTSIPVVYAVVLQDFNECDNSLSFCSINARCENIFRTFSCTCLQGYKNVTSLNGSIQCADIDECDNSLLNDCSSHETCVNVEGGYTCSCQLNGTGSTNLPCLDISTAAMQSRTHSPVTTINFVAISTPAVNATVSTKAVIDEIIPTTTSIDLTIPTTTNIDSTIPITTSIDSTIPTTTSIDSTIPTTTSIDSTIPTTTSIDSTIPTTISIDSTIPTTTSIDSTIPTTTSIDSTIPTTTSIDSTIPTTTSIDSTIPTTTSIDSTIPTTTSIDSIIHTSTKIDLTSSTITNIDETIHTSTNNGSISHIATSISSIMLTTTRTNSNTLTTTSIYSTAPVTTTIDETIYTSRNNDATIPKTTRTDSTTKTASVNITTASATQITSSIDTTIPITTKTNSTVPTTNNLDATIPKITQADSTIPITSVDATIPVTKRTYSTTQLSTSIGATSSANVNLNATNQTTKSNDGTISTAASSIFIPTSTEILSTTPAIPTTRQEVTIGPTAVTAEYISMATSVITGNISTAAALELLSNISDLLARTSVDEDTAVQLISLFDAFASSDAEFVPEVLLEITKLVDHLLLTMKLKSGVFQQKRNRLTVAAVRANETSSNLVFSIASGLNGLSSPSITLPSHQPFSTDNQRISFVGYHDSKLFYSPGTSRVVGTSFDLSSLQTSSAINSAVVGASLNGTVAVGLQRPVKISLSTLVRKVSSVVMDNGTIIRTSLYNPRCVFFDYQSRGGLGDWSDDGCITGMLSDGNVQCSCNHLTSFAVLMSVDKASEDGVLTTLTIVGCSLSTAGLFVSILSYSLFRHLRKHKSKQILLHFCVALFGVYITYIFGIVMSLPVTQGQCIASGFFLHFFTAASFAWMLIEVLDMYLMFVKVWGGTNHTIGKMCTFAWGFPFLLTIATLGSHFGLVQAHPGMEWFRMYPIYRETGVCWISTLAMYWAFLLPMGIILFINILLFSVVIYHVTCKRAKTSLARIRSNSHHVKAKQHVINATAILLLSGPTWVIGFFINIDPIQDGVTRRILSYVFVIFNAFQGLWIFIVFTVRPRAVRSAWMDMFSGKRSFNSSTRSFGRRGTKSGTSNSYLSRVNRRKSSSTDTIRGTASTNVANGASQASRRNSFGQVMGQPCSSTLQQLYRYQ